MKIASGSSDPITEQNWAVFSILTRKQLICGALFSVLFSIFPLCSQTLAQRHNIQQHRHAHLHRSSTEQNQRPRGIFGGGLFAPIKSVTNKLFGDESDVEKTPVNPPPAIDQSDESIPPLASEARRRFRQSNQRRVVTRTPNLPAVPPQDPPSLNRIGWVGEETDANSTRNDRPLNGRYQNEGQQQPSNLDLLDDAPIAETKLDGFSAKKSSRSNSRRGMLTSRTKGNASLPPIESEDPEISDWLNQQAAKDAATATEEAPKKEVQVPFVKSRPIARKQKQFSVSKPRTTTADAKPKSKSSSGDRNKNELDSSEIPTSTSTRRKNGGEQTTRRHNVELGTVTSSTPSAEARSFEIPNPNALPNGGERSAGQHSSTVATPNSNQNMQSSAAYGNVEQDVSHTTSSVEIPRKTENVDSLKPDSVETLSTFPETGTVAGTTASAKSGGLRLGLPQVRLELNGPRSIRVGEDNTYSVRATNESIENLQGLFVRIGIPTGVTLSSARPQAGEYETEIESDGSKSLIWQVPSITANSSNDLQIVLQTKQPRHFALDVEWTAIPVTGSFDVQVEHADLQLALEGPSEAIYGEPELYRLRIKNSGNAVARDISIELNAADYGSSQTNVGDIPPGSERIVEVELTFQELGKIAISSSAKSLVSDLNADTAIEVDVQAANLVAQWTGPEKFYQGSVARYELVLRNQGQATSKNIQCTVALPRGIEPVQVPDGAIFGGRKLTWTIPSLSPDSQNQNIIKLRMGVDGDQELEFSASGTAGGETDASLLTQVESITDLNLAVIDPVAPAPTDAPVKYELEVVNRGTKPAKMVEVIAQFSKGIEPVDAKGHGHRLIPGQVLFDTIPVIGPGESVSLTVIAQADVDGMHRFRAEVTCDDDDAQLVHEESTRYLATRKSSSIK